MLFLRILDEKEQQDEEQAKAVGKEFESSLQYPYRWRDWAEPPDCRLKNADCGSKRKELQEGDVGL